MIWAYAAAVSVHLVAGLLLIEQGPADHMERTGSVVNVRYLDRTTGSDRVIGVPLATSVQGVPAGAEAGLEAGIARGRSVEMANSQVQEHGRQKHYFDVTEVDTPAAPTPDWALDPSMLVRNAIQSLKVEVLVSETGRAERCTIVSMQPARPDLRALIARQLCETRLVPAIRSGVAVPSVRHVEILIADE